MAILFADVPGGLRPVGASCAWPTSDLRFWRAVNGVCFLRLQIRSYDASGGRGPIYGLRGGWWTGIVVDPTYATCDGSDPLISFWTGYEHYSYLNVWRALAEGRWTSSIRIDLIPVTLLASSRTAGIIVGPETGPLPASLMPPVRVVPTPASCANGVAWSITVRDDGTFSIA